MRPKKVFDNPASFLAVLISSFLSSPLLAAGVPRPDHVVVVMEENHNYREIIGAASAPYINSLARAGALFTDSHAIEHPSQPNYLDLFSGCNQGVTSDSCPHTFSTPNLGEELIGAGFTFGGYSESMPSIGYTGCSFAKYVRKHSPWVNFTNVPAAANMPFTSWPSDFSKLPTVSFVVPNLNNDMHNGTIQQADSWLESHIDTYRQWAMSHNSLLIVTWDEDDKKTANHIPTIFIGPMVRPGLYAETINHFNVLRTLEDMYDLTALGESANARPITNVWTTSVPAQPLFLRGDTDEDGRLGISDVIVSLGCLFQSAPCPACWAEMDVNDDEKVDTADCVYLLIWRFLAGPPPPPPFPVCGPDETNGLLHACEQPSSCP